MAGGGGALSPEGAAGRSASVGSASAGSGAGVLLPASALLPLPATLTTLPGSIAGEGGRHGRVTRPCTRASSICRCRFFFLSATSRPCLEPANSLYSKLLTETMASSEQAQSIGLPCCTGSPIAARRGVLGPRRRCCPGNTAHTQNEAE